MTSIFVCISEETNASKGKNRRSDSPFVAMIGTPPEAIYALDGPHPVSSRIREEAEFTGEMSQFCFSRQGLREL